MGVPLSACRSAWAICSGLYLLVRICCPPPRPGARGQRLSYRHFVRPAGAGSGVQTKSIHIQTGSYDESYINQQLNYCNGLTGYPQVPM